MPRAPKSHQSSRSQSVIWLTPPEIQQPLGPFDLDPCAAPEPRPFVTAARMISLPEDGLAAHWEGRVWLNPPYGTIPLLQWMARMAAHNWGTALIPACTETRYWWRYIWPKAAGLLFLGPGRLHFHLPDGTRSKANSGASSVLCAYGMEDLERMADSGISGHLVPLSLPRSILVAALCPSWCEALLEWVRKQRGPVSVAEAYRAFASHPKARRNMNWRAKIRQTFQRGPFRSVSRGTWKITQ